MYGYAFGAAKANVWHDWDTESMIYPAYEPRGTASSSSCQQLQAWLAGSESSGA